MTLPSVGWTSSNDNRSFSALAAGEDDAWARWIPEAWQAVSDPTGRHVPPLRPLRMNGPGHGRVVDEHGELLAWWGPFTHLMFFGLGWNRPDLALQRWRAMGYPTNSPILKIIHGWWGEYTQDFVDWSKTSHHYGSIVEGVASASGSETIGPVHAPGSGGRWFGPGHDEMHIGRHLSPLDELDDVDVNGRPQPQVKPLVILDSDLSSPRATLLLDQYAGWYRILSTLELPAAKHGRNWRVNVVVKPLGWLGEFRRSKVSNRWFQGQHRWHALGFDEDFS